MQSDREERLRANLKQKVPEDIYELLDQRDGAAWLLEKLPEVFSPKDVASGPDEHPWDLIGYFYRLRNQWHQALSIYDAFYNHIILAQLQENKRYHKGTPLVWISDCFSQLGFPVLAKRYLMLAHCEDSINLKGNVSPGGTGVYFRLVWGYGISDGDLRRYAEEIYKLNEKNPEDARFPEWILQDLDKNWMNEFPSPKEASVYHANVHYIHHLISKLGEPTGKILERLADYILSCMPGCRTTRRQRSFSTDYDIVCSMEGFEVDFRSELGRYFVCECKDWDKPADFTSMAKFCRVLDSTKSRFGILFSKSGISGQERTIYAEREQLKVFQDRGMIIVVIEQNDLDYIAKGGNFTSLLRMKYERVRLDLAQVQGNQNTS
jgi:hypothetical protein